MINSRKVNENIQLQLELANKAMIEAHKINDMALNRNGLEKELLLSLSDRWLNMSIELSESVIKLTA